MTVSFSSETKKDICAALNTASMKKCCGTALLYGVLLTANTFCKDKIILKSENKEFIRIVCELIEKYAKIKLLSRSENENNPLRTITLDGTNAERITHMFGGEVLRCSKCRVNFITGCFLSSGTLSSPDKNYYAEMKVSESAKDKILSVLYAEGFDFKFIQRRRKYYLYLKESERIEDFLYYMGAKTASYKLMDAKIVKELRNNINRTSNCEIANMEKTLSTAAYQIKMIDKLINDGRFDDLDGDLKETAMLRKENMELSLEEIAALSSKTVSKSGIFRRLKKIVEIAEKL